MSSKEVLPVVTSRDVARLAGVSQSTVSYVMSGRRSISPSTRRRVEEAIAQLDFQPNAGARALVSQRTQVIGLVVPFGRGTDTAGLLPFIESLANCAREGDYDILLVTADEGAAGLRRLGGRSLCDAIVMMDIEANDARIPVAASLRVPVVMIGVPDDSAGLHCVDLDFTLAGRMAVRELASTGHDRAIVLGRPPEVVARDVNFVRRFQAGAAEEAESCGLAYELVSPVEPTYAGVEAAVRQSLAHGAERPGIVVSNSQGVQETLQVLRDRGLEPGRDVSVIGHCTDPVAAMTNPPVTNVALDPREVSRRTMQLLFRLLDPERTPPSETVELVAARLTRRKTTMPAR